MLLAISFTSVYDRPSYTHPSFIVRQLKMKIEMKIMKNKNASGRKKNLTALTSNETKEKINIKY